MIFIFCQILKSLKFYRDADGNEAWYEARAVIEYRGSILRTGVSMGHYTCDVRDNETWFRTNDFQDPKMIEVFEVSKMGYAYLFQRKSH